VRPGELLAELVVLAQPADLGARYLEPAAQRAVRGALTGRNLADWVLVIAMVAALSGLIKQD
jgi:hypothetical protein